MRVSRALACGATIAGAGVAFACGGGGDKNGGTGPADTTPASISVAGFGANDTLFSIGETKQLTATVRNAANEVIPSATVVFDVSAGSGVAGVTGAGLVTALSGGAAGTAASATIRATAGSVNTTLTVPVRQKLAALGVTPGPTA